MKILKITLALSVVFIIGLFVFTWSKNIIDKFWPVEPPENLYVQEIQRKIESLKKLPENVFCLECYKKVQDAIKEFHANGSLGLIPVKDGNIFKEREDSGLNDQWKEILSKNLYSAYAPKFVQQAMFVFNHSEWKEADLQIIRAEVKNLKSYALLGSTGFITSFDKINTILAKHDEIYNFNRYCQKYPIPNYQLNSSFPDASNQVKRSRAYLANQLDNTYVNNCVRLKNDLVKIPKLLFDKHVYYLKNKISKFNSNESFKSYVDHIEYNKNLYKVLKGQIEALDNDIYGIEFSDFSNGQKEVSRTLEILNTNASKFYDLNE